MTAETHYIEIRAAPIKLLELHSNMREYLLRIIHL